MTWNNGKSGAKLDLTSLTTPGLQIHKGDHTRTANPCGRLPCRCAALLLVGCPHSLVYLHLPVVEGLIFYISATSHLGTSFPLFHDYSSAFIDSWCVNFVYSSKSTVLIAKLRNSTADCYWPWMAIWLLLLWRQRQRGQFGSGMIIIY